MLEMIIEPILGDTHRKKMSLISQAKKVYDCFVLPKAIADNIKNGQHHDVYSIRIENAERKCRQDSDPFLQHCTYCKSKLNSAHFTQISEGQKRICDDCYEAFNTR